METFRDEASGVEGAGRPDVFAFSDYRSFLTASFEAARGRNPAWSYNAWARKLGLYDNSSLIKIVRGQREPGPEVLEKLCRHFRFTPREREYFAGLVGLSRARGDGALQLALMGQLKKLTPSRRFHLLNENEFAVISRWYPLAIRQLLRLRGATSMAEPSQILKRLRFKLTLRQVRDALASLLRLGLIERAAAGATGQQGYALRKGSLKTTDDVASEAIRRYHEDTLALARQAVRAVPVEEREVTAMTIPVRRADLARAKERIRAFYDEFEKEFEADDGDEVYQLQTQYFPLTR